MLFPRSSPITTRGPPKEEQCTGLLLLEFGLLGYDILAWEAGRGLLARVATVVPYEHLL